MSRSGFWICKGLSSKVTCAVKLVESFSHQELHVEIFEPCHDARCPRLNMKSRLRVAREVRATRNQKRHSVTATHPNTSTHRGVSFCGTPRPASCSFDFPLKPPKPWVPQKRQQHMNTILRAREGPPKPAELTSRCGPSPAALDPARRSLARRLAPFVRLGGGGASRLGGGFRLGISLEIARPKLRHQVGGFEPCAVPEGLSQPSGLLTLSQGGHGMKRAQGEGNILLAAP